MNATRNTIEETMEDTGRAARRTANGLKTDARRTARNVKNAAEDAYEGSTLENIMEESGRRVRNFVEGGEESVKQLGAKAEEHIHQRPLVAVAGAFLAGVVLSRFMR